MNMSDRELRDKELNNINKKGGRLHESDNVKVFEALKEMFFARVEVKIEQEKELSIFEKKHKSQQMKDNKKRNYVEERKHGWTMLHFVADVGNEHIVR